jgi:hypothetical protein
MANAAKEMSTVTGFGPAGGRVPARPSPRNTMLPVWNAVKTLPNDRKQIAS